MKNHETISPKEAKFALFLIAFSMLALVVSLSFLSTSSLTYPLGEKEGNIGDLKAVSKELLGVEMIKSIAGWTYNPQELRILNIDYKGAETGYFGEPVRYSANFRGKFIESRVSSSDVDNEICNGVSFKIHQALLDSATSLQISMPLKYIEKGYIHREDSYLCASNVIESVLRDISEIENHAIEAKRANKVRQSNTDSYQ